MADIERLVLNLHSMGEILVAEPSSDPSDPTRGLFALSSGAHSAFYISGRDLTGFSRTAPVSIERQRETRDLAIDTLAELADGHSYNHLYGIPQAATPIAAMVAHQRGDSLLWGRVGVKDHGLQAPIQGSFEIGDTVAEIDNVITAGGSALTDAEKLEALGLQVPLLFVLIERRGGGSRQLHERGDRPPIEVHSAIGEQAMVEILKASGRISSAQLELVEKYRLQD